MGKRKIVGNTTATPFIPSVGGDNSPKGAIEFSNGIQLRVNKDRSGIEFYDPDTGDTKTLFIIGDDGGIIYATEADDAYFAMCDADGNFINEHYATKEEVGNIETALDAIIALQNSYSGVSE